MKILENEWKQIHVRPWAEVYCARRAAQIGLASTNTSCPISMQRRRAFMPHDTTLLGGWSCYKQPRKSEDTWGFGIRKKCGFKSWRGSRIGLDAIRVFWNESNVCSGSSLENGPHRPTPAVQYVHGHTWSSLTGGCHRNPGVPCGSTWVPAPDSVHLCLDSVQCHCTCMISLSILVLDIGWATCVYTAYCTVGPCIELFGLAEIHAFQIWNHGIWKSVKCIYWYLLHVPGSSIISIVRAFQGSFSAGWSDFMSLATCSTGKAGPEDKSLDSFAHTWTAERWVDIIAGGFRTLQVICVCCIVYLVPKSLFKIFHETTNMQPYYSNIFRN